MRWRIRIERTALAAGLLVAATSIRCVVSNTTLQYLKNGGTTISQDCLPRRQRQVEVTDVSLLCDHLANDDSTDDDSNHYYYRDVSYTNKVTCLPGDLGKVAIGCT